MKAVILAFFVAAQINAGPPPEELVRDLQVQFTGGGSFFGREAHELLKGKEHFPISNYLQVAARLQALPEGERIAWLRMAVRTRQLHEPAVILARMLIVGANDKQLRPIQSEGVNFQTFPEWPIAVHRGVPFLVASGNKFSSGAPQCIEYVEHLLANGTWRSTKFKQMSRGEIIQIAAEYLESLEPYNYESNPPLLLHQIRAQAEALTEAPERIKAGAK